MTASENSVSGLSRRAALTRVGLAGAGVAVAAGSLTPVAAQAADHPVVGAWIMGGATDPVGEQVAAFLPGGLVLVSAVATSNSNTFGTWTATDASSATLAMASISRDPQGNPVRLLWSGQIAVDAQGALAGSVHVTARDGTGKLDDLGTLDFVGARIAAEAVDGTPTA
jgi:hypothetical protein